MRFKFENLVIWQRAMDFGEEINMISGEFPKKEIYNLTSQIMRAAYSVALNISGGSILQSKAECGKFPGYSVRSLAETVTCLFKAKRRAYISEEKFNKSYNEGYNLMNMIIGYRNKILS